MKGAINIKFFMILYNKIVRNRYQINYKTGDVTYDFGPKLQPNRGLRHNIDLRLPNSGVLEDQFCV